jgi:hypothetical protein
LAALQIGSTVATDVLRRADWAKPMMSVEMTQAALSRTLFGTSAPIRLGRFEVIAELGQGSMGVVCAAVDTASGEKRRAEDHRSLEIVG